MRITNVFGGFIVLLGGLMFDYTLLRPMFTWADGAFTGDMEVLIKAGIFILFAFITLILPVLVATEDTKDATT